MFLGVTNRFRASTTGKLISIKDLHIASLDPEGFTGVVAQFTEYEITEKESGGSVKAQATTITSVEENGGEEGDYGDMGGSVECAVISDVAMI